MSALITIRRTHAMGDVIQAVPIALALADMGLRVSFQCLGIYREIIRRMGLRWMGVTKFEPTIQLDDSYEQCREALKFTFMRRVYYEFAKPQAAAIGVDLRWEAINPPIMARRRNQDMQRLLSAKPKPWVAVCPRSGMNLNRTVPDVVWAQAARQINGTCVWLGTHAQAPHGIVDAKVTTIDGVIGCIDACDLLVTTDTGPMHIACAMGVPTVAVQQAVDPRMAYGPCDWLHVVDTGLVCSPCCNIECPIDRLLPPCQGISPEAIAAKVNQVMEITL